jgi:hypothetical protein
MLSGGAFQDRAREIAALRHEALKSVTRHDLVLELEYVVSAATRVRAMVTAEQACSGFLTFAVEQTAETARVVVTAPERARQVAQELFDVFGGEQRTTL